MPQIELINSWGYSTRIDSSNGDTLAAWLHEKFMLLGREINGNAALEMRVRIWPSWTADQTPDWDASSVRANDVHALEGTPAECMQQLIDRIQAQIKAMTEPEDATPEDARP